MPIFPPRLPVSRLRSRAGNLAVMTALLALALLGTVGLSVDIARGYALRNRLMTALDAGALAGGRVLGTANVEADLSMYFNANLPKDFMGAIVDEPKVTVASDLETMEVSVSAVMPTLFMHLFGYDYLPVTASNRVRRTMHGLELALVLDVTGSMWSSDKIGQLRNAASDLVNILFGSNGTLNTLWMSVVPYTATLNLGANRQDWLTADSPTQTDYVPDTWRGCVEARSGHDADNAPPATAKFKAFLYPSTKDQYTDGGDNDWLPVTDSSNYINSNDRAGPNLGCGPPLLPPTNVKQDILDKIAALKGVNRGGTMANLGLQAGWFTLSPKWRGLWGGATPDGLPFDYGLPDTGKAVVLLTDGSNEWYDYSKPPTGDFTAYGRLQEGRLGTTDSGTATSRINTRMLDLCTAMKAQKITIYTITLMVTSQTTKDLYMSCASQPIYYFNSPSAAELRGIFQQIGTQLSNLRLEK
jgi:Flp pilus assembly protein TadG